MKTAVEQLIHELNLIERIQINGKDAIQIELIKLDGILDKAKEMEKEQMIDFAKTIPIKTRLLQEGGTTYMRGDAELHYNETFKQQEQ
jgi:hypothetical protein